MSKVRDALDALDDAVYTDGLAALSAEDIAAVDAWANNVQMDIMRHTRIVPTIEINAGGFNTTGGRAISARGASNKNGAAKILKAQGWYWLSPVRAYVTKERPLHEAARRAAVALRNAGLNVKIVGQPGE
jgi:hypothetical protein